MRAVLGIDAAWTLHNPSGVALAVEEAGRWRVTHAASSYPHFHGLADPRIEDRQRHSGARPDAGELLATARKLCGFPVTMVAVDMPLSHQPIMGRRGSDNAVSSAYGGRFAGTHTPSAVRPGAISDALRAGFGAAGYPLLTGYSGGVGLIEVYPHPALIELAGARQRLPYKHSKIARYWPAAAKAGRPALLRLLRRQWDVIVYLLEEEIDGVSTELPPLEPDVSPKQLKSYEDTLDAIICAWVAICVLEGRARPFGDAISAVWVPKPIAEWARR